MLDIKYLVGTKYKHSDDFPICWSFCHYAGKLLGLSLAPSVWGMRNMGVSPILLSIVVFNTPDNNWHAGIVYPDCLHFIHVAYRRGPSYIRLDSLNHEFAPFVKGYYVT